MSQLRVGLLLTIVVGALIWVIWDRAAAAAGMLFALLAVGIQIAAVRVLRPAMQAPLKKLAVPWLVGTALRLGGAAMWAIAVLVDRTTFPPLATAVGYLGVVVPLLFMETRFLK